MKVSVSLPDEDVDFLDKYRRTQGFESRSAVVHRAVRLLRTVESAAAYEDAWQEFSASGDEETWEAAIGDGRD